MRYWRLKSNGWLFGGRRIQCDINLRPEHLAVLINWRETGFRQLNRSKLFEGIAILGSFLRRYEVQE